MLLLDEIFCKILISKWFAYTMLNDVYIRCLFFILYCMVLFVLFHFKLWYPNSFLQICPLCKLPWSYHKIKCQRSRKSRAAYFRKLNPLLFAGFSLPRTKLRLRPSEGVVWAQNQGHFWTQRSWKPLCRLLVWPCQWI